MGHIQLDKNAEEERKVTDCLQSFLGTTYSTRFEFAVWNQICRVMRNARYFTLNTWCVYTSSNNCFILYPIAVVLSHIWKVHMIMIINYAATQTQDKVALVLRCPLTWKFLGGSDHWCHSFNSCNVYKVHHLLRNPVKFFLDGLQKFLGVFCIYQTCVIAMKTKLMVRNWLKPIIAEVCLCIYEQHYLCCLGNGLRTILWVLNY